MAGSTTNQRLLDWVSEWAALMQPDDIYWCDGSAEEYDRLCQTLVDSGTFTKLDDAALDALLELTSIRRLPARAVLFRKGEPGHQLYGVIEGRLRVSASGSDGKEVVFTYSDPGDVIGDCTGEAGLVVRVDGPAGASLIIAT